MRIYTRGNPVFVGCENSYTRPPVVPFQMSVSPESVARLFCWNGNVEIALRELVDGAARKLDMKLNSLGSVRSGKINSELSYAELELSIVDKYENVVAFIAEIDKFYWK